MLTRAIRETTFGGDIGNRLFPNITSENQLVNTDDTVIANMRIFLHPRLADGETARLVAREFKAGTDVKELVLNEAQNELLVYSITGKTDENEATIKAIKTRLERSKKYESSKQISAMLSSKQINGLIYRNSEKNSAICVIENINCAVWHLLGAIIPALLQECFRESPITADSGDEAVLLSSLLNSENDSSVYLAALERFEHVFPVREARIRTMISPLATAWAKREIENLQQALNRKEDELRELERRVAAVIADKYNQNYRLIGAKAALLEAKQDNELEDLFVTNKHLHIETTSDSGLYFCTTGYLDNYSLDDAETYIENKRSAFYYVNDDEAHYHNSFFTESRCEQLMSAIFSNDPILKVRVASRWCMTIPGSIEAMNFQFSKNFDSYLVNPHLHYYQCRGDNGSFIDSAMDKCDYVVAVAQCLAANANINLSDPGPLNRLMSDIYKEDCKAIIELPNGEIVTPQEACEWLDRNNVAASGNEPEAVNTEVIPEEAE